jgi:hypothetical protein
MRKAIVIAAFSSMIGAQSASALAVPFSSLPSQQQASIRSQDAKFFKDDMENDMGMVRGTLRRCGRKVMSHRFTSAYKCYGYASNDYNIGDALDSLPPHRDPAKEDLYFMGPTAMAHGEKAEYYIKNIAIEADRYAGQMQSGILAGHLPYRIAQKVRVEHQEIHRDSNLAIQELHEIGFRHVSIP